MWSVSHSFSFLSSLSVYLGHTTRYPYCILIQESRPSINREGSTRSAGGVAQSVTPPADGKPNPLSRTLFAIFGGNRHQTKLVDQEGAKKVDAKLFFAVERTFLAWMKAAIMLAGFSIAVGSFTVDGRAQALYSLFFLAVAIALTVYCLVQCKFFCVCDATKLDQLVLWILQTLTGVSVQHILGEMPSQMSVSWFSNVLSSHLVSSFRIS